MSDAKFTKGPWGVWGDWAIQDKNGLLVGQFESVGYGPKSSHEMFANAHLMATAPEMYEMLESLREDYGLLTAVGKDIDKLLAKARGE